MSSVTPALKFKPNPGREMALDQFEDESEANGPTNISSEDEILQFRIANKYSLGLPKRRFYSTFSHGETPTRSGVTPKTPNQSEKACVTGNVRLPSSPLRNMETGVPQTPKSQPVLVEEQESPKSTQKEHD
ncbi:hypothetical protein V1514DRAFT_323010 [Lipomyces japonicus]|uniref:uncharacterized protein n=1 Tax=Lipomyces japonicus TaxID=56871 RepID=UPI0034CFF314